MKNYLDFYLSTLRETPRLPTFRELEKNYIDYLLKLTHFNVTWVSRILAISRTAVYYKIHKYNISCPPS